MLSAIGHAVIDPGTHYYVHGFTETGAALFRCNAESTELARIETAAGTPVDAAARENVQQSNFFSQTQRMIERGKRDTCADAQTLGTRSRIRAHHGDRRTYAVIVKVMLGQPDGVVARLVHDLNTLKRALVHGR